MKFLYLKLIEIIRFMFNYEAKTLARFKIGSLKFHLLSLLSIYRSQELMDVDVAWWTYPAMDHVRSLLEGRNDLEAFEFGPGASTKWLSKYCKSITYVEYDREFYDFMQQQEFVDTKVDGLYVPPDKVRDEKYLSLKNNYRNMSFKRYVQALRESGKCYDVIVIDGRARSACLEIAGNFVKPGGIVIFDNSNRRRYARSLQKYNDSSKKFRGWAPTLPYMDETTVIYF